jgi:AcrR family transcriptional regulator
MPASKTNKRGQELGSKGQKTRQRLVDAARKLMEIRPIRDLTVADIVRESHSSIPTFYVYFEDVYAVALAALEHLGQSPPPIEAHLTVPWGRNGLSHAKAFVEEYLDYYNERHALFRAINFLGEDGDPRFVELRRRWGAPLVYALGQQIATNGRPRADAPLDPIPPDAAAAAAVLLAMVDRLGPILRQPMGPPGGGRDRPFSFKRSRIVTAAARTLVMWVQDYEPSKCS